MSIPLIIAALVLLACLIYDIYVLHYFGMSSGKTVSWMTYVDQKHYPVIAIVLGMFSAWLMLDNHVNLLIGIWFYILGHLSFVMKTGSTTQE